MRQALSRSALRPLAPLHGYGNLELEVTFCVGGVISPLLANVVLNHLDWSLADAGYRFARYADDFVIVCSTQQQAQEALTLVQRVLEDLGLALSPEKTRITTYGKGYEFLGFFLSSRSRRMRDKSVQRFKTKVRELTIRKRNLDRDAIRKLNRVVRGTANYNDNRRVRVGFFRRKFGLLTLEEFCTTTDLHGQARRVTPRRIGATSIGVAR